MSIYFKRNFLKSILRTILFIAFFIQGLQLFAIQVQQTLYINRGVFTTVSSSTFPFLVFNDAAVFNPVNFTIRLNVGDSLNIKVINNDTVQHGFDIQGFVGVNQTINPGDSITDLIAFPNLGAFIFYDPVLYPVNRYLGLGGMIAVGIPSVTKNYFWNIKEHETALNYSLVAGGSASWNTYEPDYFTINGYSYPDLQSDTSATINGLAGQVIYIFITNTGQSKHSLHFHGYHAKVKYASDPKLQVNTSKDTFPLSRMNSILLELIPDKPGQYSVHDHNLIAVSGGGVHPNGMFTIMTVQ